VFYLFVSRYPAQLPGYIMKSTAFFSSGVSVVRALSFGDDCVLLLPPLENGVTGLAQGEIFV